MTGVAKTGRCPFATDFDILGVDASCMLPYPKGFWAKLRRIFFPWCVTGFGGCGDGTLPCRRYEAWRRAGLKEDEDDE